MFRFDTDPLWQWMQNARPVASAAAVETLSAARTFDYIVASAIAVLALYIVWRIVKSIVTRVWWLLSWSIAVAIVGVVLAVAWNFVGSSICNVTDTAVEDIEQSIVGQAVWHFVSGYFQ